jgi:hypothetical protein
MSSAYKLTELGRATPGMALGADLLDRQGQLLLPKDAILTAGTLASLARHGVDMLPIVADDTAAPAIDVEAVQARLDVLFRKSDSGNAEGWASADLRRYVEGYRLGREVAP